MSDARDEGLVRRIQDLYATDTQFAAARPDDTISAAMISVLARRARALSGDRVLHRIVKSVPLLSIDNNATGVGL